MERVYEEEPVLRDPEIAVPIGIKMTKNRYKEQYFDESRVLMPRGCFDC